MCGVKRLRPSSRLLRGWEVVLGLCFLPITGAEARLSTVRGAMKTHVFRQKYKEYGDYKVFVEKTFALEGDFIYK